MLANELQLGLGRCLGEQVVDFELTPKLREFQALARDYADKHLRDGAAARDAEQRFPAAELAVAAQLGLLRVTAPVEYGGAEFGNLASCLMLEEINAGGTTILMVTHDPELAARAHRNVHIVDGQVSDLIPAAPALRMVEAAP